MHTQRGDTMLEGRRDRNTKRQRKLSASALGATSENNNREHKITATVLPPLLLLRSHCAPCHTVLRLAQVTAHCVELAAWSGLWASLPNGGSRACLLWLYFIAFAINPPPSFLEKFRFCRPHEVKVQQVTGHQPGISEHLHGLRILRLQKQQSKVLRVKSIEHI